ncbi:unnamed protein product [Gordionus sp. m RMFG-2023]
MEISTEDDPCSRCSKKKDLHCGSDNMVYRNPCLANCVDVPIKYAGLCIMRQSSKAGGGLCFCPNNLKPVCSEKKVTFHNECYLMCEKERKKSEGKCGDLTRWSSHQQRKLIKNKQCRLIIF